MRAEEYLISLPLAELQAVWAVVFPDSGADKKATPREPPSSEPAGAATADPAPAPTDAIVLVPDAAADADADLELGVLGILVGGPPPAAAAAAGDRRGRGRG